jgi:hypothetical protein
VVISQPDDDGLDWDQGWQGSGQFIIVQQNAVVGNRGIEADNNGNANDATPRSAPEIWNMTLVGSGAEPGAAGKTQGGIMFRRGTAGSLNNSVITAFADFAIDVADASTVTQAEDGALAVATTYFFNNANDANDGWPDGFDEDAGADNDGGFDEQAHFNGTIDSNVFADPGLADPTNLSAPDFSPSAGAAALEGSATPPAGFDAAATFLGAIGTEDWTAGWTAYPGS